MQKYSIDTGSECDVSRDLPTVLPFVKMSDNDIFEHSDNRFEREMPERTDHCALLFILRSLAGGYMFTSRHGDTWF